jgi:hypothetical protein
VEKIIQINDRIRLNLLDRCFKLGLPASSEDDINTLKMYLDVDSSLNVDSKFEEESFNFFVEKVTKKNSGIKSLIFKMFSK